MLAMHNSFLKLSHVKNDHLSSYASYNINFNPLFIYLCRNLDI